MKVEFNCLNDLSQIIPREAKGKVLNYGQGEGQVEIQSTVWGIYYNGDETFNLQFEEGKIEWSDLISLTKKIMDKIHSVFGEQLGFMVEGCLNHHEPHEKYLS